MRLGFTIQEAYIILLVGLTVLIAAGTAYGAWALDHVKDPERRNRLLTVHSRMRMGWWLIE